MQRKKIRKQIIKSALKNHNYKVPYFGEELRMDSRVNGEKGSESSLHGERQWLPKYRELNSSLKLVKPLLDAESARRSCSILESVICGF